MHWRRIKPFWRISIIIGGVVMAVVLAFVFGLVVMVLWNWIMPDIFGLPTITYWQGWGLVLLAHILFKMGTGFNKHPPHDEEWKERFRRKFKPGPPKGEEEAGPEEASV